MSAQILEQLQAAQAVHSPRPILIIEDDDSIAEVLQIRLKQQGYQVRAVRSGREGLELARSLLPRLVLLDLKLPDADGFEICRQLDEDLATSDVPVIILSGLEQPNIVRQCRAAGCQYFIRKPYDPNALLILIQRAIDDNEDSSDLEADSSPHEF